MSRSPLLYLHLAAPVLDNLTLSSTANLQRLDGSVRGNGQVIQELEALFTGAGWNVVKVIWGSDWDPLFARDSSNALLQRFAQTVDGQYQTLGSKDGAYNLLHFFQQIRKSRRWSRICPMPISMRSSAAVTTSASCMPRSGCSQGAQGASDRDPGKTKKGYGMGGAGESRMTSHQAKKLGYRCTQGIS